MSDEKKLEPSGDLPASSEARVEEKTRKSQPDWGGPLPTNIERATADHIRKKLSDWDDEILRSRAARLSVSAKGAASIDNKPLFMVEVENRAKAEGRSVEQILDQYQEEFLRSRYPTPDCFLPNEIVEYLERNALPEQRLAHTDTCSACSMLLATFLPKGIDDLLQAPPVSAEPESAQSSESSREKSALRSTIRYLRSLTDQGAAILLPVLLLALGYGAFLLYDRSVALRTVPSDPRTWTIAIIGTFVYLVTLRGFEAYRTARSWATAAIVGFVLLGFLYVDFSQSKSSAAANVNLAFKWARTRASTESLALEAMKQRRNTGEFPTTKQAKDIIGSKMKDSDTTVENANVTSQEARYTLTTSDLQGKIIADIGPETGTIRLEDGGGKVLEQLLLRTVTVKNVTGSTQDAPATMTFDDGHKYPLTNSQELKLPGRGDLIVAAMDPRAESVDNFRIVSFAGKNKLPPNIR